MSKKNFLGLNEFCEEMAKITPLSARSWNKMYKEEEKWKKLTDPMIRENDRGKDYYIPEAKVQKLKQKIKNREINL